MLKLRQKCGKGRWIETKQLDRIPRFFQFGL